MRWNAANCVTLSRFVFAAGILLAALPISAELLGTGPAAALMGTLACLSAMEELALLVKMPELDRDVRGLFLPGRRGKAKCDVSVNRFCDICEF